MTAAAHRLLRRCRLTARCCCAPLVHYATAQPVHSLQSPLLYQLYCSAVAPRLPHRLRRRLPAPRRYYALLLKTADYLGALSLTVCADADAAAAIARCTGLPTHHVESSQLLCLMHLPDNRRAVVIAHPERNGRSLLCWQSLQQHYPVSLHLGYAALLLSGFPTAPQHHRLRG